MVSPSRSSSSVRSREDVGKFFLGGLVLLGVVASVLLVLSDSVQLIRVGLVVALWAAVLGAWAVSRYQAKVRDLRGAYERELEREISARREHELGIEARVRSEMGGDATEMAALRAELAVLRRQLERLFDGELPPERPALPAASFRIQELPSAQDRAGFTAAWPPPEDGERRAVDAWANAAASWSHAADGWVDTEHEVAESEADTADRNTVTPVYESDHPGRPRFAGPDDDPITAETAIVRLDDEPVQARPAGLAGSSWADAFTEVDDATDMPGGAERHGPPHPAEFVQGPPRPPEPVHGPPAPYRPAAESESPKTPAAAKARGNTRAPGKLSPRSVNSRRRRTQSDPAGSRRLSVAEIMANLRREEEQRSS